MSKSSEKIYVWYFINFNKNVQQALVNKRIDDILHNTNKLSVRKKTKKILFV